jgi:HAE1 family hydrophobic/amphiphilic exporter-1
MCYVVLTVLGFVAWSRIPIEQLPSMSYPNLSVGASWGRTSAEVMEAFVTAPLEAEISQIRGVETVRSTSREGSVSINVSFARGTDMQFARIELIERISAMRDRLPPDLPRPSVSNLPPAEMRDAEQPLLTYRVTGPYMLESMREQIDLRVIPPLQGVDGIAGVDASGGARRMIRIDLNPEKILAYGVTPEMVVSAVRGLQLVADMGMARRGSAELSVVIRQTIDSVPNISDLIITSNGTRSIRVSDVGSVHDTFEEATSYSRVNGFPALTFTVRQQARVNTVELADTVKALIPQLEKTLLQGMQIKLMTDRSVAIRDQLKELRNRSLVSAGVIFLVLLIFLWSFRSTAIVFSTIAFSVLMTLNLMYFGGHTVNVLTLTGLSMGFGIIVDNAIVVIENIFRRRRLGDVPEVAAERGSREVAVAVVAATLTTVIVFIPFIYLQGTLRAYYLPLAIVVVLSQMSSLLVAFSFVPALAAKALRGMGLAPKKIEDEPPPASRVPEIAGRPGYVRMYAHVIALALRWPWVAVVIAIAMVGASYKVFDSYVPRGGIWGGGGGGIGRSVVTMNIRMPNGEELERTEQLARYFDNHLRQIPEVEEWTTTVSSQSASFRVTFPDSLEYTYAPYMVFDDLSAVGNTFAGPSFSVYGAGKSFNAGGGVGSMASQRIQIFGYNFEKVREIAEGVAQLLRGEQRVQNVDPNGGGMAGQFSGRATEIVVEFNREKLGLYGVTVQQAVSQLTSAVRGTGMSQTFLRVRGDEIAFGAKVEGYQYQDLLSIQDLQLQSPGRASPVRLRDVSSVYSRPTLVAIARENQQYTRAVSYEFRGPGKLADRVRRSVVAATHVPEGYKVLADSESRIQRSEQKQIYGVLALSIVLVFMVTAALFESLRQPLCVLLTVPMALIGVFLMFFYVGASFTREAYIGVIIMGGIVVNNSILLVDRVNRLRRAEGWLLRPAIVQGTLDRVRPILMTTSVTIVGLLPLVLFQETVNQNIWNALAYALMGGLTSSTILVLTVTPALYLLFEKGPEKRRLKKLEMESTPAAGGAA